MNDPRCRACARLATRLVGGRVGAQLERSPCHKVVCYLGNRAAVCSKGFDARSRVRWLIDSSEQGNLRPHE